MKACRLRHRALDRNAHWSTGTCRTACSAALLFAGEMVLLLHWSMLNYTAVVKILKKHGASMT